MPDSNSKNDPVASAHQMPIPTQKVIIEYDEGNDPTLEPLFANHFELFQIGTDIFLDVGIVRPEEIISFKEKVESAPSEAHTITFNVLQRIVMSRDGFERLKSNVEIITRAIGGDNLAH